MTKRGRGPHPAGADVTAAAVLAEPLAGRSPVIDRIEQPLARRRATLEALYSRCTFAQVRSCRRVA